ncbi:hypothetical protein ACG3SL_17200 [Sphingomonas sp. CJ20]
MMKWAATALAVLVVATPAWADPWDFILVNSTGKAIKSVEVSPGGAGTWVANKVDEDLKKEALVKAGGRMTVHFDKGSGCKYDVKAVFEDGTNAVWSGVNVCDNSYVTVKYAGGTPTFTAN